MKCLIKAEIYKTLGGSKISFIISFGLNIRINFLSIGFISEKDFEINKDGILTVRSYKS